MFELLTRGIVVWAPFRARIDTNAADSPSTPFILLLCIRLLGRDILDVIDRRHPHCDDLTLSCCDVVAARGWPIPNGNVDWRHPGGGV